MAAMISQVVGIAGHAQHGKDTAAAVLIQEAGYTRIGLADAVRELVLAVDPLLYGGIRLAVLVRQAGWEEAKKVPEVRRLLQAAGTEGVRQVIGEDAWIRALKRKIDAAEGPVVVPDVRFANEADALRNWGGLLIRVRRLNEDGSVFDNGLGLLHPSEAQVDGLRVHHAIDACSVTELESLIRKAVLS